MSTGYIRQSAAQIVTGNTINASDFNNEYNKLQDAFDGTSGHDHTGGAGLGQKLVLTTAVTGTLPIANGGTAGATASAARTALGLAIGTDVFTQRTITGTANEITITNGSGVSGNPTLSLPTSLTFTGKTVTGGAYTGATIENTPIGASTASTGAFTSLSASSFSILVGGLIASGGEVQLLGTTNDISLLTTSGSIGISCLTSGDFTLETSSGSMVISAGNGLSLYATSGTIDGADIGSILAATGTFTKLTVTDSSVPVNGMYLPSASNVGISANSFKVANFHGSGTVVNFLDFSGAATGVAPAISFLGSDTNVPATLTTKGTGGYGFFTNSSTEQFGITHTATVDTRLRVTGGAGVASLFINSSLSNADLSVSPKGTGLLQMGNAASFVVNGSVATVLGSVGPVGSHTTVQKWFAIKDSGGTTYYIPAF